MERFCMTQKRPTQKSANAKLARKKLVMERRRRESVTTSITSRLPVKEDRERQRGRKGKKESHQISKCPLNLTTIGKLKLAASWDILKLLTKYFGKWDTEKQIEKERERVCERETVTAIQIEAETEWSRCRCRSRFSFHTRPKSLLDRRQATLDRRQQTTDRELAAVRGAITFCTQCTFSDDNFSRIPLTLGLMLRWKFILIRGFLHATTQNVCSPSLYLSLSLCVCRN